MRGSTCDDDTSYFWLAGYVILAAGLLVFAVLHTIRTL
jgi:hypothetical protein